VQTQTTPPSKPGFFRRNLLAVLGAGAVALAGLGWLAFGYFGIHTAFIDDEVAESGPVFASGAAADEPTGGGRDVASATDPGDDPAASDSETDAAGDDGTAPEPDDDARDAPAEIVTLVSGTFAGLGRYSGGGDAVVLNDGTEQRFLRFEENFETSNGPDLNVYLTVGGDVGNAAGYVDLGDLRGNIGSQNYEIPVGVDLAEFDTVVIWCVRFGVGFAEAPLA